MKLFICIKSLKRLIGGISILVLILLCTEAQAARAFTIKVATIAPKGSIYHRVLQEMGEKWRAAQGDNAKFIIYTDGSQGTEAATVRRLRVGQLQASMLSVAGLMELVPSVTALQFMPGFFRNWDELDYVLENIRPQLEREFEKKGYKVLLWGMGGWVQFFSVKPRFTPEDYRDAKIFTWAGTKEQQKLMISLGFQPVVLDLPDLLPAVQTGMVDVIPVAPMWALSGQFYRYAPHMLKMNWVPIVGCTVLSSRTWNDMRPEARDALAKAAKEAEATLRVHRASIDNGAIEAMQERGLVVHEATPEMELAWQKLIEPVKPNIRGGMVPADIYDTVNQLLKEYRGINNE